MLPILTLERCESMYRKASPKEFFNLYSYIIDVNHL
jgi:hypothetical protein